MAGRDIIVVGASAGGVEALKGLVQGLPSDLPAALLVVLHMSPHSVSRLPMILSRAGTLPAVQPADGAAIEPGTIYVAPPDHHLLIRDGRIHLSRGPRENGHRPAVDPLFRSAARAFGGRTIGIILSGTLDDGAAGLTVIKRSGGVAIVQDPDEAVHSGMPRSAIEQVRVDYVVPLVEIAPLVTRLVDEPAPLENGMPPPMEPTPDTEMEAADSKAVREDQPTGAATGFVCPDCGGAMWEIDERGVDRYRCRVGHSWSASSLLAEQAESLETALWTALRALEESAALADRIAGRLRHGSQAPISVARFEAQARSARRRAQLIRKVLSEENPIGSVEPVAEDHQADGTPQGPPTGE